MIVEALLALIALVVSIVAIAQLSALRNRIENLEKKLSQLPEPSEPKRRPAAIPPPLPPFLQNLSPPAVTPPAATPIPDRVPGINWESFVGVRLFAWIGGLALFLGVVFFVKYAFENNLVTPRMRIISSGF